MIGSNKNLLGTIGVVKGTVNANEV